MFFPRLKKEKNILVFDIGSSSVNASLLLKKENEIPVFLSFSHLRLPLLENPDFTHIERHARKAGKETNRLELSIYLSAARRSFRKNIEDMLTHFLGNAEIKRVSEPSSLFRILSEMINPKEGYLVVDVGGEVTEIYLVRNGVLENTKNFAWGANLVIRRVASSLNIGLGEALSFFTAQSWGDIKEATDKKLSSSSLGVCSEWQTFLGESLSLLGREHPLPQTLVVLGGVAGSDILKKCLNSPDFASFTILGKPFDVISFIPENFGEKILTSGIDRKDSKMTLPLLLALSALKYGNQK